METQVSHYFIMPFQQSTMFQVVLVVKVHYVNRSIDQWYCQKIVQTIQTIIMNLLVEFQTVHLFQCKEIQSVQCIVMTNYYIFVKNVSNQ